MLSRVTFSLLVLGLIVASCGGDEGIDTTQPQGTTASSIAAATTTTTREPTTTHPVSTTQTVGPGCDVLHQPGEYEGLGSFGSVEQPYWMTVPASYAEIVPAPLYLHLASGSGSHGTYMDGWRPYLDDLDGLMVMVNTAAATRGEPEALESLIDQISTEYCVDPQRVHVMGTAYAADMAEQLVCEHSDKVASFIAALGSASQDCTPDRPVPLLTFTGDADRHGIQRLVDKWVGINECDPVPVVEDLGSGVQRKTYQNCKADILFYDIEGMGHAWPLHEAKGPGPRAFVAEYEEVDYLEEALSFFAAHPLP